MKKLILALSIFSSALFADYYNDALFAYMSHNYSKAKTYFKLSCIKEKDALGCFSYANMINNEKEKKEFLQKACELGLKKACE